LATSFLAAPAVQAQMGRGQCLGNRSPMPHMGNRGVMPQQRAAWSGNHGFPQQSAGLNHRGRGFDHRGPRAENRNYHPQYGPRQWARGPYQHPGQHQGWGHSNARPPYQARAYGNYRPPYGPAAYGPRNGGYNRGPQAAFGPGRAPQPYSHGTSNPYGPGSGTYNGYRPPATASGVPGTITQTSTTPSGAIGTTRAGGWMRNTNSGTGWTGHHNTRVSSESTIGGVTPPVAAD
jgi:hypothetical protein